MEKTSTYTAELNQLLASYQIHYQNLRSLHWNIKGQDFFELHLKYEELYNRTLVIIDDLAERILSIGETPLSNFSRYLESSPIAELEITHDGATGVAYILSAQQELLKQERVLLASTDEADDEGTNALMSDLIREKEKTNWMFKAWLNK
jgi:starvation-inducible DNA-binding protein